MLPRLIRKIDSLVAVATSIGLSKGTDSRGNAQVVKAKVPLAEMFGYATDLRSMTQGRATYSMQFSHYQPVPRDFGNAIAAKAGTR